MKKDFHPAEERMGLMVESMAWSTLPIRQRFKNAFQSHMIPLQERDFTTVEQVGLFLSIEEAHSNIDRLSDSDISDVVKYKVIRLAQLVRLDE